MSSAVDNNPVLSVRSGKRNSALDYGLRFAFNNLGSIIFLAAGPLLLQILCTHIAYLYALGREEWFVIVFCLLLAEAWVLNSLVVYQVESLRGYPLRNSEISKRGIMFLPKVLLSFVAVTCVAVGSMFVPFLLALVPFVVWAPVFVSAESFAKPLPPREEDEAGMDLLGEDGGDDDDRPKHLFTGMALWDLGLGRSFGFSGAAFPLTLELVVLMWAAHVFPNSIFYLLFGSELNFVVELIALVLSSLFSALVFAAAVAAFFALLPKAARDELEIPKSEANVKEGGRWSPTRPVVFFLLSPLAGIATFFLVSTLQERALPPKNLSIDASQIERQGEFIIWNVKLDDKDRHYRWLDPNQYRLAFKQQLPADKAAGRESPSEQEVVLQPERFYVFQNEGRLVEHFQPFYGPLRVEVRFRYPPQLTGDKSLALHYFSKGELGDRLGETRLSAIPERK